MNRTILISALLAALIGCHTEPLPNNTKYTIVDDHGDARLETIGCRSITFEHWNLELSVSVYRCYGKEETVALKVVIPIGWALVSEEIGADDE